MKDKMDKHKILEFIENLFSGNPTPKEIKKAKKISMSKNIKLGGLKIKFCKRCNSFFDSKNSEIRIKKEFKIIKCKKCGHISRYGLVKNEKVS